MNEVELIHTIKKILGEKGESIGDDCAVLPGCGSKKLLVTMDLLEEKTDFDFQYTSPRDVGYKATVANLSDIAGMGGTPTSLLFSLAIPCRQAQAHLREFYRGVSAALQNTRVIVAGGDLSQSNRWVVSGTAFGYVGMNQIKRRSGAKPGDLICVVGELGWSAAGLCLLQRDNRAGNQKKWKRLIQHHLRPKAQIRAGQLLGRRPGVTAMIDVSDGLSKDLGHICDASRCSAILYKQQLPVSPILRKAAISLKKDVYEWVLHGGEDFSLLYTCRPKKIKALYKRVGALGLQMYCIGTIDARGKGIRLINQDEKAEFLARKGWDHFS